MQSHLSNSTQNYSDEEIKQAIASSSHELLNQLNPDYPIYQLTETIYFGDLPIEEQEALKQTLSERRQTQLIKYQF
ncbi:MAG: hypothetical protein QNJ42_23670 [Crocosphaera sp.]|nr:hypothetical protein [Crocosphaera sp.]